MGWSCAGLSVRQLMTENTEQWLINGVTHSFHSVLIKEVARRNCKLRVVEIPHCWDFSTWRDLMGNFDLMEPYESSLISRFPEQSCYKQGYLMLFFWKSNLISAKGWSCLQEMCSASLCRGVMIFHLLLAAFSAGKVTCRSWGVKELTSGGGEGMVGRRGRRRKMDE